MLGTMFGSNNDNFESYYQKRYGNAKIHYKKILKVFDRL